MKGYVLRRLAKDADVIFDLYSSGANFEELAERYGCAWQTIRRFLVASGISLRRPTFKLKLDPHQADVMAALNEGVGLEEIAQRYGVQPETVRRFLFKKLAAVEAH